MEFLKLHEKLAMVILTVLILSCGAFADVPEVTSAIHEEVGLEITSNIDNNVDPCTDFYHHACGGWMVKHPLTSSLPLSSQFGRIERKVEQDLKDLLENDKDKGEGAVQKVKDYYKTCVDEATIDGQGLQPLMSILTANGDWPLIVDEWNPQQLTWQKIHENFMTVTEYSGLFALTVDVDERNSSVRVITFRNSYALGEGLSTSALQKHGAEERKNFVRRTAYEKYAFNAALEFTKSRGFNVTAADVQADVTVMLAFKKKLDDAMETGNDHDFDDGIKYRITTIKEAQNIWDAAINNDSQYRVDWLNTIKKRFEDTGITIDENEKLALQPGIFFQRLATLLSQTPVRTIVNFIHWHAVDNLLRYSDEVMRQIRLAYLTEHQGLTEMPERWRLCSMYNDMTHALSYMYVKAHFSTQFRTSFTEVIDQIREASKETISNSSWMGENERKLAKEKVDAMKKRIGYPDWYDVPGKIDEYYSELSFGPTFFDNVLSLKRFNKKKLLRKLRDPVIDADEEWGMFAIEVNAGYDRTSNSLNFPAAILRLPFYHSEEPPALKFGGMGGIIGHEISHGFDNNGRLRDKHGNKRQWWSNSTIDAYLNKIECFVNQYSQFEITRNSATNEPIYVNGTKTISETVADNLGLRISFKAFQKYKSLHPNETIDIPALRNYSDDQLFFYGLANNLCMIVQPAALENVFPILSHPPTTVRLNGAVSNMEEFANAFGCASGTKMNPTNKCVLWD